MVITRSQIPQQIDGKLRGARNDKKRRKQKVKSNSKRRKV